MSLTRKRKMTEKNLDSHRRNGAKSRGPVTPEGKARAARANLRHGFYFMEELDKIHSPENIAALMAPGMKTPF